MNTTLVELAGRIGVTANSLKKWRNRGKVPHKYRLPLLEAAQKNGLALSIKDFEFKATPRPKKRAERRAAA